jgi:hypothetical protein
VEDADREWWGSAEGQEDKEKSGTRGERTLESSRGSLADRVIDPDDLAGRFTRERIRGIGQKDSSAVRWFEGSAVRGNKTRRAAPVGLVHLGDLYQIYRCFPGSPENFEQSLFTAGDAGHDADTVAAMACAVAGAYHGHARLPKRLVTDLEFHDRLLDLADGLDALHRKLYSAL